MREEVQHIKRLLEEQVYVTDTAVATALYLAMTLGKPLLVEKPVAASPDGEAFVTPELPQNRDFAVRIWTVERSQPAARSWQRN